MQAVPGALARFLLVYAALYAGYGLTTPFLPALLAERGLTPTEVGLVLAAGTGIRLVAGPLAGRIADRLAAGRGVLAACAALSAASALLYLAGHGFAGLLLAGLAHAAATAPLAPLADALALPASRASRFAYGTVRGAGSAAFIAGTLAAGQVTGFLGLAALPVAGAAAFAGLAAATLRLPAAATGAGAPATAGAGLLLRSAGFLRLVAVAALVIGSHAVHDAFAVIRWRGAGLSPATVACSGPRRWRRRCWSSSSSARRSSPASAPPAPWRWRPAPGSSAGRRRRSPSRCRPSSASRPCTG